MTALALDHAYQSVGELTGQFHLPTGKKSITAMKQAICLTTDKSSLKVTEELLEILNTISNELPINEEEYNEARAKSHLLTINETMTGLNSFFETIKLLFDNGADLEKDDDTFLYTLANLERAKKHMEYISGYLGLVNKIQKDNAEGALEFSLEELKQFVEN